MDKGDYFSAKKYIDQSRDVLRRAGYRRSIEYVSALRADARLATLLSNYDDAEEFIDEAIKIKGSLIGQNEVSSSSASSLLIFELLLLLLWNPCTFYKLVR
jgi:hypothetical protein